MSFPEDSVFPVHALDGSIALQEVYCVFTRVDHVLDPTRFHNALWEVLGVGDWRKLAGRIRRRGEGLEIHVPAHFTNSRPPLNFVHEPFEGRISDHPIIADFTQSTTRPSVRKPPQDMKKLALCPGFPAHFGEIVDQDVPQLSIKVMTFADATLLATSFVHVTWDAFGYFGLLKAVQQVLEGRSDDLLPVLGARDDVLKTLARPYVSDVGIEEANGNDPPPSQPAIQTPPPSLEDRCVCMPNRIVSRLRDQLKSESTSPDEFELLKDDEMCLAWFVQQAARSDPQIGNVSLVNLLNARVLVPSIWKARGIYLQNMFLLASNKLNADVASSSIEPIVLSQRDCQSQLAGTQQTGRYLAEFFEGMDAKMMAMLLFPDQHTPVLVNNLCRITGRLKIDLSHAIAKQNTDSMATGQAATSTFFHIINLNNSVAIRSVVMLGNVTSDAFWMSGCLSEKSWDALQAALDKLESEG